MVKFLAETEEKSDELTREKNELLLKPLNDSDEDLEKAIALLEKIWTYQENLREGYGRFNML